MVLMGRQTVLVLGVIVIIVGVRVQQWHDAGRRDLRREEQQRQHAVHNDESMGPRDERQRQRPGRRSRGERAPATLGAKDPAHIR